MIVKMFEIYGRSNCSWCDAAKALLERKGLQYLYYDVEKDREKLSFIRDVVGVLQSVPQILKQTPNDGDHTYLYIGGYKDLEKYLA